MASGLQYFCSNDYSTLSLNIPAFAKNWEKMMMTMATMNLNERSATEQSKKPSTFYRQCIKRSTSWYTAHCNNNLKGVATSSRQNFLQQKNTKTL